MPTKTTKTTKRTTKPRKATQATAKKAAAIQSFKLASNTGNFMTFRPSVQTLYWLIIGVLVILLASWALSLQLQILEIYDQIDNNAQAITDIKVTKPQH